MKTNHREFQTLGRQEQSIKNARVLKIFFYMSIRRRFLRWPIRFSAEWLTLKVFTQQCLVLKITSRVQVRHARETGILDLAPGWLARMNAGRDHHVYKNLLLPEAARAPVVSWNGVCRSHHELPQSTPRRHSPFSIAVTERAGSGHRQRYVA